MRRRASGGEGRRRRQRGFSLLELLTALLVASSLARVAVPNYHNVQLRARAAEVAGDIDAIRHAAFLHMAERYTWPGDEPAGVVPQGLSPHLPDGFRLEKDEYRLDWEHWPLPDGLPGKPEADALVGVTLETDDEKLARATADLLHNTPHFSVDGTYTFLIESP